ncbi:MAG: hypothetical protein C3F17_06460 [Bradyrhizobiaceae bacterium]|nr:MAG: hypothetical protein C3F17_06460 [Bradyrhizobiaceae bacterium]
MLQSTRDHGLDVPLVSIGVPVHNGARFLERALVSLRAQDYPAIEIIISDNASSDETHAICARHAGEDARIRLIRQTENRGPHANFEAVCLEARGRYFMWAADDDFWLPTFVSRLVAELEAHSEAGAAMCATRRVREDGTPLDEIRFLGRDDLARMGALRRGLAVLTPRKYNLFIYAVYRAEFVRKGLPYFPRVLGGDRIFVLQFALTAPLRYVDEILYLRTHRPAHEASYLAQFKSLRVRFGQFRALCAMIYRSAIIPGRAKLALPILALAYALFLVRKEAFQVKTELISMLRGVHRRRWEGAAVALAGLFATAGYLADAAGGVSGRLTASPLFIWTVLGILGAIVGLVLVKLDAYRRFWLRNVGDIAGRQREVEARYENFERFAKFATDLLLAPPPSRSDVNLEGWAYGQNNQNTVRKQVYFARSLEVSRIRELYLKEIFPDIEAVSLPIGAVNEVSGHANKADMLYVCAIAKLRGAKRIFEFGTYQGRTTYHLALASEQTQVTTLDLPPDPKWAYSKYNGIYFRGTPVERRVTQLFQDSRTLDTRPLANSFDFVFVDADHSYDSVKNDTQKAFELLCPGGIIMWHDYAPKSAGLVQFFKEFTQQRPLFRVKGTCLLLHIDGVDPMTFEPHPMLPSLELEHKATDPFQIEQIYHH